MLKSTFNPVLSWMLIVVAAAAVVSLVVSFQLGLLLLLFAVIAWWVWQNPDDGLIFFLVIAPLLPLLKFTQTLGSITLIKDVIILTLFVRLVAWPLFTKRLPYRRNVLLLPLLFLAGWVLLGVLQADSLILGVLRARDSVLYLFLYLAILYLPTDPAVHRRRCAWFMVGAFVVLLLGVYQWFFAADSAVLRFDPARSIWIPRISATFAHPSVFGEYLILLTSLLLASALTWRAVTWRLAYFAGFVALLPFIYLTYSRGVWLGLAAAVIVILSAAFFAAGWKKYLALVAVLALLLMGTAAYLTPAGTFIRATIDPTYKSNAIRLEFAARLLAPMTNREALMGRGLGDVVAQKFIETDIGGKDIAAGQARDVQLAKDATLVDNQYLKTFVELGLTGLLIYAWIYWRLLKTGWRLSRTSGIPRLVGLATVGFVAAFIVQAFFIDIWDIFPTNAYFWIIAGLASQALDEKAPSR